MVKFLEKFALVIVLLQVAKTKEVFLWKTVDPTLFTNLFHRKIVLCASVELTKRGAKKFKKIECEGFMNSFINASIVLYSYKSQLVLLTYSTSELIFMILSYLPFFKLKID